MIKKVSKYHLTLPSGTVKTAKRSQVGTSTLKRRKEMKDLVKIFQLEDEAEALLQKIKRMQKHNEERSPVGREGMHEQIEIRIRIAHNRREALLKELKELEKEGDEKIK